MGKKTGERHTHNARHMHQKTKWRTTQNDVRNCDAKNSVYNIGVRKTRRKKARRKEAKTTHTNIKNNMV